jgi:NAD(P)-dependent dehydrogenase (short-subunit alcohol dehydrogenase family)
VRRDEDARDAAAFVEKHLGDDEKLWAVVNNAGIIDYCGVDLGPEGVESYSRQMDVNVFGVIRVTKSFLPLIRKTRGARIILVGSVAGRFIAPAMTGYSMSKFALRAFAEGLRREMSTFGVQVSVVEPIFYKTAVSDGALALRQFKSNWDSTPDSIRKEYGETRFQVMYNAVDLFTRTAHKRVEDVVETLSHAICILPEPEPYFRVCYTLETVLSLIEDLPEEIVDCISNEYVGPPLLRAVAAYNSYLDI